MAMLQVTVLGGLVQNKIIRDFYSSKNCVYKPVLNLVDKEFSTSIREW